MTRKMTSATFLDYLDKESSWRRKELITLKLMHDKSRDHQRELLRRAGVALLYAHWEGFVKKAGTEYVRFVANQFLRFKELTDNFVALGMKAHLGVVNDSEKGEVLISAVRFLRHGMGEKATLTWDKAVRTKSNLSSERLRDVVSTLGLDYTPFAAKEKLLIQRLLDYRNGIAYGQNIAVDEKEFVSLHEGTLEAVDEFKSQLIQRVDEKAYRMTKRELNPAKASVR